MHSCLQLLLCLVAVGNAAPDNEEWNAFKSKYGKQYKDADEEQRRMKIFIENSATVEAHNTQYQKETSYQMGINEFSDMDSKEFVATMTGDKPDNLPAAHSSHSYVHIPDDISSLPEEVNWINKGYVTPVKHQGRHCGSCWAFSATGVLEGQNFKKTEKLVSLSEEQLVDCDKGNNGCGGGWKGGALAYIAENGGINSDETYPYEGIVGECKYDPTKIAATCKGFVAVDSSELALQAAVATIGPIAVSIFVQGHFYQYENGVYYDPDCRNDTTNHAVLVVGYGRMPVGKKLYWMVKNSWGVEWGNKGYIFMERNKQGLCGIARTPLYAIV